MSQGSRLAVALTTVGIFCGAPLVAAGPAPLAEAHAGPAGIEWAPLAPEAGLVLTISGPEGFYLRQDVAPGAAARFSLFDEAGGLRPAGSYVYELRLVPQIDETTRAQRAAARENGGDAGALLKGVKIPATEVQHGAFAIQDGAIVMGGEPEPGAGAPGGGNRLATKDQVIPDDLIVQGSICAGFDCVNNESFGFDTIRMKENNTRIDFTDTSTTTGFPTQDWEIAANDSASGGRNALIVSDENTQLFVIESGNSANAIYIDDTARVGFRTSNPVLDIHISTTNTPGLRLEQTSAGGFTAQTWDIAGNEANFFVRDVTGGSRLPFRIRPGAPTSSIDIANDGDVGIGTASPGTFDNTGDHAAVHIRRTADTQGGLLIERATTTAASDVLLEIRNNGTPRFDMIDTNSGTEWRFEASGAGFNINDLADGGTAEFVVQTDGDVIIEGSLTVGPGGCTGCDLVFSPEYDVETIEDHAAYMWANRHLPGVGATPEDQPMNLSKKTGGILNELEKAHIYIEQLHGTIRELEAEAGEKDELLVAVQDRLARLEAALAER